MKSVKIRSVLWALLITLILSNVLGAIAYFNYNQLIQSEISKSMQLSAIKTAESIGNILSTQMKPLLRLSESVDIKSMDWEKQRAYLSMQTLDYFQMPFIADKDGNARFLDGEVKNLSEQIMSTQAQVDKPQYSDVILNTKTQSRDIWATVPITNLKNEIVGALGAKINLEPIFELISHNDELTRYSYIINEYQTFVAHDTHTYKNTVMDYDLILNHSEDHTSFETFLNKSYQSDAGLETYSLNHETHYDAYAKIPGTEWRLYVGNTKDVLFSGLNDRKLFVIAVAIILNLFALFLAYLISQHITTPILEMDKAFCAAAAGDLNIRLHRESNDEIGRAAKNFNLMMSNLRTLTYFDTISGLPNLSILENALFRKSSNTKGDSLLLISMDQFSKFNELYGYNAGDMAIQAVALRIKKAVAEGVTVYRGKGDEFIVYFDPSISDNFARGISEKIQNTISEPYFIDGKNIVLKFSMGFETRSEAEMSASDFMLHAVYAKNIAKSNGGNQFVTYNVVLHNKTIDKRSLEEDLVKAVKHKVFHMVYQPIFSLTERKLVDVEALIRWEHSERGFIPPDTFISLAEQMGLIIDIDRFVIDEVFKQQSAWQEKHVVSINISAHSFESDDFIPYITEKLNAYQLKPNYIQLELTERVLVENIEQAIDKLNMLRRLGFRIAIDDFGIGYSSLNYLVRLPLDSLKIDKSFVNQITTHAQSIIIVKTILNMCEALHLQSIAEGIEDRETLDLLIELGCHNGQGYFLSRPIPADMV